MNEATEQRADNLPTSLTGQLIAYIGNKRRLLPFLAPILAGASRERSAFGADALSATRFLDPMSGSGAVSRLARHLGFTVSANDWEEFACTVTAAYLENTAADLDRLFGSLGGLDHVLSDFNAHGSAEDNGPRRNEPGYIATNFAPRSTANPRIGRERLFYTAENARFLDRVRDRIDERFPAGVSTDTDRIRRVLIALLLYEASNHANTSGVFKAYHRGFGGHGKDALSRILAPMHLERPEMIDGPAGEAGNEDALLFVQGRSADICYLDPPYNSHQYGSNYFMLNTIARWDKPPVDSDRDGAGCLVAKAGIRPDWTETKSPFCYRKTASGAFAGLIDTIDAAVLVVSYSASGFISPEEMADLLAPQGELTLHGTNYTAYRGGRQSLTRASSGHELVFVVRRPVSPVSVGRAGGASLIARQLGEWKVHELLRCRFVPERLLEEFSGGSGGICLTESVSVPTIDFYRLDDGTDLSTIPDTDLRDITARLERACCADHGEEFRVLLSLIRAGDRGVTDRAYHRRLLTCLRKYAHRKYRLQFWESVAELQAEIDRRPTDLSSISSGLSRIVEQARSRFGE